jgi:hypothetical protein
MKCSKIDNLIARVSAYVETHDKYHSISEFITSVLNQENLDKLDRGVDTFTKGVQNFGDSMNSITKEMLDDVKLSESKRKSEQEKNTKNIQKLFGDKSDSKIWSD